MWELLTGEEPYGDMHCGSIIGRASLLNIFYLFDCLINSSVQDLGNH